MKNTGELKNKLFNTALIIALMFLFGTAARANVSPAVVNFGTQSVGATSAPVTVTFLNSTNRSVTLTKVSVSASQFAVSAPSLPMIVREGQSVAVAVTFSPAAAKVYLGALTFAHTNGFPTIVVLNGTGSQAGSGTGTGTGKTATINAISGLSFSGAVGASVATQSFSVTSSNSITPTFSTTDDAPWLTTASVSSRFSRSSVTVAVNTTGMTAGTYTGHVIVTVPNQSGYTWTNSPYSVPVTLTVTGKPATTNPAVAPSITSQPASQTIAAGKTATFNVAATGTAPMAYQWNMNGAAISGATSSSYTTPAEAVSNTNAQFTVSVSNSAGKATSNAAILTVNAAAVAPSITSQPASQTITSGKTATFNVAATGTAPMSYQWSMNGAAISGATSSSYTTPAEATSNNSAKFTVAVSNSAGNATSNAAVLTVNAATSAPSITSQPASQTIIAGKTASFSVVASGTATLTYQWSMNGTAISGATSATYTTPAETVSNNNATFTVAVGNSAGNVTSNPATLTVTASTLTLNASVSSLSFGNVNVSSNSTKTVTLTNAGNANITVSNVTISGAGFNTTGVSSGLILTPGQTATLTATFAPSAAGSMSGSVTVASNATNSPDQITLSGTGVAAPVNHSVSLSWAASTSSVIGYNTYSSTVSGGPYTKLTNAPVSTTSYTDSSVQSGQTYYYVVTSVATGNVESSYSGQISANVP